MTFQEGAELQLLILLKQQNNILNTNRNFSPLGSSFHRSKRSNKSLTTFVDVLIVCRFSVTFFQLLEAGTCWTMSGVCNVVAVFCLASCNDEGTPLKMNISAASFSARVRPLWKVLGFERITGTSWPHG